MIRKKLYLKGVEKNLIVDADESLPEVLRKRLALTSTKVGGGKARCDSCNVIKDSKLTRSCVTKMSRVVDGADETTTEEMGTLDNLYALKMPLMVHGAQCGFCTPGFIVFAKAYLNTNSDPSREDEVDWFQQNRNVPLGEKAAHAKGMGSQLDGLASCAMCKDNIAASRKRIAHLLDYLFPSASQKDPLLRPNPGFSRSHGLSSSSLPPFGMRNRL